MKLAYFDCLSGISGDMTLGALVDAGLSVDELKAAVGRLPVEGYELSAERIVSKGISGTRVSVSVDEAAQPAARLLFPRRGIWRGRLDVSSDLCGRSCEP